MADVASLTFNPFQENTYLVYDETGECVIIDPGCHNAHEEQLLSGLIEQHKLTPVRLLQTHCHIDHVLGCAYVADKYHLKPEMHSGEFLVWQSVPQQAKLFGISGFHPGPAPETWLTPGESITFGSTTLEVLFTPGHSPASVCFYSRSDGFLIGGDVLFLESIGRTDLPGGDMPTLLRSIREEIFPLGDEVVVYPGHGPRTTIGHERQHNPFL